MINTISTRFTQLNIVYIFIFNTKTSKIVVRLGHLKSPITREINIFSLNNISVHN